MAGGPWPDADHRADPAPYYASAGHRLYALDNTAVAALREHKLRQQPTGATGIAVTSTWARLRGARAGTGLVPGPVRNRPVSLAWPRLPAAADVTIVAAGYAGYALVRLARQGPSGRRPMTIQAQPRPPWSARLTMPSRAVPPATAQSYDLCAHPPRLPQLHHAWAIVTRVIMSTGGCQARPQLPAACRRRATTPLG